MSRVSRGRFGAAHLVAALACGLAVPAVAQAVVIHVDAGDPAAVPACVRPTVAVPSPAPCTTIQWALGVATHHDRIDVAPGTYNESLLINKRVTVAGAQAGVDARSRPVVPDTATETIINGTFEITKDHAVTVDGLVVRGGTDEGIAIDNAAPAGTYRVLNSIIAGNGRRGIRVWTTDADPAPVLLRHNRIAGNDTGPAPHAGVLFDGNVDGAVLEENAFGAGDGPAVDFDGSRPGTPATFQRDIAIRGNRVVGTGGVRLAGLRDATVAGNEIEGSQTAGVLIDGGASAVRIDGNRIHDTLAGGAGVLVRNGAAGLYGPNRDVVVTRNSIAGGGHLVRVDPAGHRGPLPVTGNRLIATAGGVHNGAADMSVDARDNWWGSNAGPGPVNTGAVLADPWLVLRVAPSAGTVAAGGIPVPVTASLGQNSAGQTVTLQPVYGGDVAFHTGGVTDSTFVPATAPLIDGRAESVMIPALKPGQEDGDETLGATLDGETVAAPAPVSVVTARGPAGATGATGATGSAGTTGATGAQGMPGAQGAPGATGPQGGDGVPGADGPQGRPGATGPAGAPGAQGAPGLPAPTVDAVAAPRVKRVNRPLILVTQYGKRTRSGAEVSMRMRCPAAAVVCRAQVRLNAGPRLVGSVRVVVRAGTAQTLRVPLTATGQRLLNRAGDTQVRARVVSVDTAGITSRRASSILVRR